MKKAAVQMAGVALIALMCIDMGYAQARFLPKLSSKVYEFTGSVEALTGNYIKVYTYLERGVKLVKNFVISRDTRIYGNGANGATVMVVYRRERNKSRLFKLAEEIYFGNEQQRREK